MVMVATGKGSELDREKKRLLLKALTYERVNGRVIYYRDYKKVLKGELPPEAVIGSSSLHAWILWQILNFLSHRLDKTRFAVLTGEFGFKYAKGSWRNIDIGIFEKEKIKPYLMQDKMVSVPPLVAIEIDTKADLTRYASLLEYAMEKTQDLIGAGVERVVWFFTKVEKVLYAQRGQKWLIQGWEEELELFEGITFNLKKLMEEEDV